MHLNRHIAANVNPNRAWIMKTEATGGKGNRGTVNELANLHGAMNINEQLNNIARCSSILICLSHSITTSLHASLAATHLGLINIIARVNASAFPLWRQLIKCGNNAAQHNTKTESERDSERDRERRIQRIHSQPAEVNEYCSYFIRIK